MDAIARASSALTHDAGKLGETPAGEPVDLDLAALIGSHLCVAANSGGGKSGAIRKLLELTHGQIQHIVLDAEDEFYTLRERFDYVIAGGDGGDSPATLANAGSLALASLQHGFSLVAQINDLGDDAPSFIATFLNALLTAPRDLWRPLLVVIDEAQRFAPSAGSTEATAAIKGLLQRGRKRGFTAVLATTRVSELHPGVRGLCNNWMLGLVGQALDRRTAADQLGFGPSSMEARGLQKLERRQFWGFGPALSREPVLFRVADVETTPVRPGQAKVPTPPPPEALRAILAGLAKAEPDSAALGSTTVRPEWPDQREEVKRLQTVNAALSRRCDDAEERLRKIGELAAVLGTRASDLAPPLAHLSSEEMESVSAELSKPGRVVRVLAPSVAREPAPTGAPGQRILNSLAWWEALGHREPLNEQVAFIAGYSHTSTSYTNPRSALKTSGLIDYPAPGRLALTDAGREKAEAPDAPPSGDVLRSRVLGKLGGPQQRILGVLIDAYPVELTNEECASRAGYSATSTSYTNPRSNLKTLNLATYPTRGKLRAAEWLFPVRAK